MGNPNLFTQLDAGSLTQAFPREIGQVAKVAAEQVARVLDPQQWLDGYTVTVRGDMVKIPARLRFASHSVAVFGDEPAWLAARALYSRSVDGYERQRAARDLIAAPTYWTAPYLIALLGEYLVEIIQDIEAGMTPALEAQLAAFISDNRAFWHLTRQRVASYWNEYYRPIGLYQHQVYCRDDYPGFRLAKRLERAARTADL